MLNKLFPQVSWQGKAVALIAGLCSALIAAQENAPTPESTAATETLDRRLEEIIVTARRRSENLQDTPVAVSAVSADEMAANNISNIAGLSYIVPGLDQREGRKQAGFAIRGVGQTRINEVSNDPGVGVYIDGIFLPRNDSQLVDAVAIEGVQVLRGPQGTLFGKNTVGGAILVRTRDPYEDFGVKLKTRLDTFGRRDIQLAADIPIIDNRLYTKLTIGRVRADGFAEDLDTGRQFGDDDRLLVVAQALANLSDTVQLKFLGYYNDQDEAIPPYNCQFVTREGVLSAARTPGRPENYETFCRNAEPLFAEEKVQAENTGLRFVSEDLLLGVTLDWELPFGEFKSISSWTQKGPNVQDFDIDATDMLYVRNTTFYRQRLAEQGVFDDDSTRYGWGQEFQLSGDLLNEKIQYTVGLFGAFESIDKQLDGQLLTKEGWVGFERLAGLPPPPPGSLYVVGNAQGGVRSFDNTSYAAFGQFLFDLLPTVQLTAGVRYSFEERKINVHRLEPVNAAPPVAPLTPSPPGVPIVILTEAQFDSLEGQNMPIQFGPRDKGEDTFERVSPMLSLSWNLVQQFELESVSNLMAYVTVAEGFKSGGFTTLVGRLGTFDPEVVLSTEVGIKMDALDRRLRLNLAAYRSDYTDIQLLVTRVNSLGATEVATTNAGEAVIQGAELETTFLLTRNVMLVASASYIDPEFNEYNDFNVTSQVDPTPVPQDRSDEPFPFIPELSYSLSLRYALPTDSFGEFNFVLSYNYRDGMFLGQDFKSGLPEFRDSAFSDDFSLVTTRINWVPFADESLQLSLYGNNILDKEYIASGTAVYDGFGSNAVTRGNPAHWGLELSYELR